MGKVRAALTWGFFIQEVSPDFNHAAINHKENGVTRIKAHLKVHVIWI
jgi:hypothetical protein